MELQKRFFLG